MEREGRGPGFQRSPKAGSAGAGFASRDGCGSQLVSFFRNGEDGRNGEEGRNLGEEGMLVERQQEGRSDEVCSKLKAWPSLAIGAGLFRTITALEAYSGRVSTRSSFGFSVPQHEATQDSEAIWEDGRDGPRPTADGWNHDLRRCRDDSACVQLEEVLCAGREVLHDYLVSQAMSMCM